MSILILYQISNEHPPNSLTTPSSLHNAFSIPRPSNGATLSSIKAALNRVLRQINPHGSSGYHWRVRIDERTQTSHDSGVHSNEGYSWWDVQDENARLPIKECTHSELKKMLLPKKEDTGELQEVTKAAKGAMKYMGKAMNVVAGGGGSEDDSGARVCIMCFKLLDLTKIGKRGIVRERSGAVRKQSTSRVAAPASAGSRLPPQQSRPQRPAAPSAVPTGNLMDFNATPASSGARAPVSHASSMPATPTGSLPNETRAEKLKREYAQKASTANRVWDEVDQRWVEGPVKNGETKPTASSVADATKSLKGISLDASNAIGKSENVANAINARVSAMQDSQQKAIDELRQREAAKASADAEEDSVRMRLEPKLKAWSEEHGKKKQLRALLANLHTILWEGSGWKPITLADVLEDSKVKKVYFKASRVVHPDKTGGLDAEKRFVAKRVFDALTQAKVDFDAGAK